MTTQRIVPATEVRAALERMVASEMFRDSPQLAAFLRFVVEAELRGESDRIKGYTIGVEALGRREDFDPQTDPIVRVEATRLRRTIERYYAGPGADDPVVIALSPGSYVPSFGWRAKEPAQAAPAAPPRNGRRLFIAGLVGAALFALLAALFIYLRGDRLLFGALPPGNGMPTVLLEPLAVSGAAKPDAPPPDTLIGKLRDAISRFDTLNVVLPKEAADAERRGVRRPIRFRLAGLIEYRDDGTTTLRFQLFDAEDNRLVWSRLFERFAAAGGQAAAEDAAVTEIVTVLAQPFGVIRAHEQNRYRVSGRGDPRYTCILEASDSLRSFDPAQHLRAKRCLEGLIRIDPSYASGFAYLAALYLREYQYDIGGRTGEQAVIDHALLLARQSIERQPESSRGYQMLSSVLYGRRDYAPSLAAAERAVALNRYDMTALSDYAGRLILSGEIDRGLELLQRAGTFGTLRPSWYNFYFFLAHYLKGEMAAASHYASQITPERYPLGHVAHALAAQATGNPEQARRALQRLVALRQAWQDDPAAELRKLIASEAIVERLAKDLAAAGLSAVR